MKRILVCILMLGVVSTSSSQENINDLLVAGINDAKRFTSDYLGPGTEGLAYGINSGWFNNAKSQKRFGFEISVIANASLINDDHKSFVLDVSDYENVRFPDNSQSKSVATVLGNNDPDVTVILTYDDPIFGQQESEEITLPTGLASADISLLPTAFVQGSFTPFKGTQVKARFFPKVETEDAEIGLFGLGIQQEFTSWLPADKVLPVAISGLVAYTNLSGNYDFTDTNVIDGENQQIDTDIKTFLFEAIVGTKLKVINFYGGIGYITGTSTTAMLGTYRVTDGVLFSEEIIDPFTIEQDISGLRGTVGFNLKLGFFRMFADYTIQEFNTVSAGIAFGFR